MIIKCSLFDLDITFNEASEQWNHLLKKPTFMNQDTLKTECTDLLQETSLNETFRIFYESFAKLAVDQNKSQMLSKVNLDICAECKMIVLLVKFILQISKVTYYINKFIDQLCVLTGPYSSECTYVAQNYAGILIDLVENTTSPKICQIMVINGIKKDLTSGCTCTSVLIFTLTFVPTKLLNLHKVMYTINEKLSSDDFKIKFW
ncbi:hypothetical protein EWB00_002079 [Schistosoma japonicum]|uniref:Saposin B-type domain-containing protein n=1 Tax=Schistosoma japonicum TaxID=6182 RepID=A0A4Z2DDH2_SCHJA|nr:hypothetical protein EWB00_002079 [Schistosoma japonicum]